PPWRRRVHLRGSEHGSDRCLCQLRHGEKDSMDAMRRPSAEARSVVVDEPSTNLEVVSDRGALRRVQRAWGLPLALIVLIGVVILHGIRRGEFDYNVDEAQHGVTGLFLADAMRALPVTHPVQYAYSYYAQYPAVSIV